MSSDISANMRATTETFIKAWEGGWSNSAKIISTLTAPECTFTTLPSSVGTPKRNNEEFIAWLGQIAGLITDSTMNIDDYVSAPSERRVVCRSSGSATTPVGPFTNEYVWFFTFDESGRNIVSVTEFFDGQAAKGVLTKLREGGYLPKQ